MAMVLVDFIVHPCPLGTYFGRKRRITSIADILGRSYHSVQHT
jgi:hypothetical protein